MINISGKISEILRNLKSDAKPRPPRPQNADPNEIPDENNENTNYSNEAEEIVIEPDDLKDKKEKSKKPFFKTDKSKSNAFPKSNKGDKRLRDSTVNTQANGSVINIVNSQNIHWGNEYVYYLGANGKDCTENNVPGDTEIQKCNLIALVMEATIKVEHEHIDYVSKNLGKNWHSFFRALGYTKGRIETMEIDEARNGVSEARYKLLLDWMRNDDDGTLGKLATLLWEEGEREIVKNLAIIYKKNKK